MIIKYHLFKKESKDHSQELHNNTLKRQIIQLEEKRDKEKKEIEKHQKRKKEYDEKIKALRNKIK